LPPAAWPLAVRPRSSTMTGRTRSGDPSSRATERAHTTGPPLGSRSSAGTTPHGGPASRPDTPAWSAGAARPDALAPANAPARARGRAPESSCRAGGPTSGVPVHPRQRRTAGKTSALVAAAPALALPATAKTSAPAAAAQAPAVAGVAQASAADTATPTHDLEARDGRRPTPRPHPIQLRHRPPARLPRSAAPCLRTYPGCETNWDRSITETTVTTVDRRHEPRADQRGSPPACSRAAASRRARWIDM
jgi:hypothetical protein